jgi:hypothetical protein
MLAWASVTAIAMSFALTAIVMANNLHQSDVTPISWDDPKFQGSGDDCKDADLQPGEVLWHFVHTDTDGSDLPSELTAEFDNAGVQKADGYSNGGGNAIVMYDIITGEDSLLSASDDIQNDGLLNLSHICFGGEEQSVAESASEAESVAESASGEQSVEAGTGTPEESTPDGAFFGAGASSLPTIAFSLILLASLGGLAYANVKSVRS